MPIDPEDQAFCMRCHQNFAAARDNTAPCSAGDGEVCDLAQGRLPVRAPSTMGRGDALGRLLLVVLMLSAAAFFFWWMTD